MVLLLCLVVMRRPGHTSRMCCSRSRQRAMASHAVSGLVTVRTLSLQDSTLQANSCTEGSGHYVKMVHNGIEYGDMQLITEVRSPPIPNHSQNMTKQPSTRPTTP